MASSWIVCADTGGTFTDVLARPAGNAAWRRIKVLSSGIWRARVDWVDATTFRTGPTPGFEPNLMGWTAGNRRVISGSPGRGWILDAPQVPPYEDCLDLATGEEAPVVGWRLLSGTPADRPPPPCEFRLATTRATNALLEGRTAPVALFLTEGFGDLLAIGSQQRPNLFELGHAPSPPETGHIIEVPGRLTSDGAELEPIRETAPWMDAARAALDAGLRDAAVCLLNAHRCARHEKKVANLLRKLGFERITLSHELSSLVRYLPRARTTRIHASLVPIMESYLEGVSRAIPGSRLLVMASSGALTPKESFLARDSLMSGPAGGLNASAALAKACAASPILTFDMGGTSTDVARFEDRPTRRSHVEISGVRLQAPALHIESVAAGGGSICRCGPAGLEVGPQSAGSNPGPSCFGKGGPLTVTDLHLLTGRISRALFAFPPDLEAANKRLDEVAQAAKAHGCSDRWQTATRLLDIADERMADALRQVTVREGHNPALHTLIAYGGAGGLHACTLAERLGIRRVLLAANSGLFSAEGLSQTLLEEVREASIGPFRLIDEHSRILDEARALSASHQPAAPEMQAERIEVLVRRAGHDFGLHLEFASASEMAAQFARRYHDIFGLSIQPHELEAAALRLTRSERPLDSHPESFERKADSPVPSGRQQALVDGEWREIPVFDRASLEAGSRITGPALIQDPLATAWIPQGWEITQGDRGTLDARRTNLETATIAELPHEIIAARLESLVSEMGSRLEATAVSVNIRERLDFSCALADANDELVLNAPHVPVHLGSLGVCVRALRQALGAPKGALLLTNHPAFGGSHLPDITLAAPVHDDSGKLIGWVINRAHHAEIGGSVPGSMPIDATTLEEEGVVFKPTQLGTLDQPDLSAWENGLRHARFPSRRPEENTADLRAQIASLRIGAKRLRTLAQAAGTSALIASMERLQTIAAEALARKIARRGDFILNGEAAMDDGHAIRVRVTSSNGNLRIDFSGTSGIHPGNLNANPAIVRSAVLYTLRVWAGGDLPLNEGALRHVDLRIPEDTFLNPRFPAEPAQCPAVMGGNVETSQRIANLLLGLLADAAASQSTMNNVVFGDATRSFYETIGGGGGATPELPGRSAAHVHMTNTAIGDPEIIEERYPVRIRVFGIRRGSGGRGLRSGGDGIVREFEFLEPLTLSILTHDRVRGPQGRSGGGPGKAGSQWLFRPGSFEPEQLPHRWHGDIQPGTRLRIETPGGGGHGPCDPARESR
jgi:5-oxoprolinase (ATP-hydrolysing)